MQTQIDVTNDGNVVVLGQVPVVTLRGCNAQLEGVVGVGENLGEVHRDSRRVGRITQPLRTPARRP